MRFLIAVALFILSNTVMTAQNTKVNHTGKYQHSEAAEPDQRSYASGSQPGTAEAETPRTQQTNRKPSREEINAQKIAFFTQELNLTPQEAEKFWPVYNESWHARGKARRETMRSLDQLNQALEASPSVSDIRIQELSDAYIQNFKKEGDIYISYFNNFKKILPLRKAVKVFSAEEKFRVILIKQLRDK